MSGNVQPMRRVVVTTEGVVVTQVPTPDPGPDEVRVRSRLVGVCGSDVHAAASKHPFITLPYQPGHEVVGVIDEVGSAVRAFGVGQRVVVEPDLPCWDCKMCRTSRENLCERLQFFGCGWHQGGLSDFFTVAANRLHLVPDQLDDRAAALIEPLATPVHAVRLAGDVHGKAVAILGAGTIALLVLNVLRAAGAGRVVVTDIQPAKRERAVQAGAYGAVDARAPDVAAQVRALLGESADIVFDCVAVQATMQQAISLASKGGTVVVVGVPTGDVSIPLAIVQDHQLRIQGSATYLPQDYEESIALLLHHIRVNDIISSVFPFEESASAFSAAASGNETKVLIRFDGRSY